jgi:hypothetical protein
MPYSVSIAEKLRIHRAHLLAQPLDVAVDGAVIDIDLIVIGHVHQLIAAFHEAGTLRERLQQQEFGHGQRHVLPFQVTAWRSGSIVSSPRCHDLGFLGVADRRRWHRLLPAQERADAFHQQALRERLLHVVVRAHAQAQHLVDLVVLGGQEDHRHLWFSGAGAAAGPCRPCAAS